MDTISKIASQREKELLASLASLQSELENKTYELVDLKEKAAISSNKIEKESNQLLDNLNAANLKGTNTKECLIKLHEVLQQVRKS